MEGWCDPRRDLSLCCRDFSKMYFLFIAFCSVMIFYIVYYNINLLCLCSFTMGPQGLK